MTPRHTAFLFALSLAALATPALAQQPANVLARAYADLQQSQGASLANTGTNCNIEAGNPRVRACTLGVWTFAGPALAGEHDASVTTLDFTGSGIDQGNSGGWTTHKLHFDTLNTAVRGISENNNAFLRCHAIGDCIASYDYVDSDGGLAAQSDEGVGAYEAEVKETYGYFHGTAPRTYGPGAVLIDPTFTTGNPWTTDGAFLIDTAGDVLAATTRGPSRPLATSALPALRGAPLLNYLTLSESVLPRTTTFCYAFAPSPNAKPIAPATNVPATSSSPITFACTLQPIDQQYRAFPASGTVCVAGESYPEQATIAAAGALDPATHVQTLTLNLRNPNRSLAVFLGGPCGRFFSFDADTAAHPAGGEVRQLFPVFGSLTGTDLIYADNLGGSVIGNTLPSPGMIARPETPNPIHLFHGAEVVGNRTARANPILEPNTLDIRAGDTLENPHFAHFGGKGIAVFYGQQTPCTPGTNCTGLSISYEGAGITAGATAMKFRNGNPARMYRAGGGPRTPPVWSQIQGPHATYLAIQQAPQGPGPNGSGGVLISIDEPNPSQPNPAQPNPSQPNPTQPDSNHPGLSQPHANQPDPNLPPAGEPEPYRLFNLGGGPRGIGTYLSFNPQTGVLYTPRLAAGTLTLGNPEAAAPVTGWSGHFQSGACTVTVQSGLITAVTGC